MAGVGLDIDAEGAQRHLGEGTTDNTAQRLACRTATATTMVTKAVLLLVSVVGMTGAIDVTEGIVVGRVLVGIAYLETNGGTCRLTFEYTRQYFDLIGFATRRGDGRLSGTTSCHFGLQELHIDGDTSRHTVDDATYGWTMAFAEGRQSEYVAESIHFKNIIYIHSHRLCSHCYCNRHLRSCCHSLHRNLRNRHHSRQSSGACTRFCPARLLRAPLRPVP